MADAKLLKTKITRTEGHPVITLEVYIQPEVLNAPVEYHTTDYNEGDDVAEVVAVLFEALAYDMT